MRDKSKVSGVFGRFVSLLFLLNGNEKFAKRAFRCLLVVKSL